MTEKTWFSNSQKFAPAISALSFTPFMAVGVWNDTHLYPNLVEQFRINNKRHAKLDLASLENRFQLGGWNDEKVVIPAKAGIQKTIWLGMAVLFF